MLTFSNFLLILYRVSLHPIIMIRDRLSDTHPPMLTTIKFNKQMDSNIKYEQVS